MLIGRRALVLLGLPVLTADYDFWIAIEDRELNRPIGDDEREEVLALGTVVHQAPLDGQGPARVRAARAFAMDAPNWQVTGFGQVPGFGHV